MADCPVGVLIEVGPNPSPPPPQNSTKTLEDLLNELGAKYLLKLGTSAVSSTLPVNRKTSTKVTSISEDDFIGNEVFDFKCPTFEDLDLPESDQQKQALNTEHQLAFEFPILSLDPPPETLEWNAEVTSEATKISKNLCMMTALPLSTGSQSCTASESSDFGGVTTTSGTDDEVFCAPAHKKRVSRGKENNPNKSRANLTFVPHPNAEEALTPKGVEKIQGPSLRRGTFTLDKNILTPKVRKGTFTVNKVETPNTTSRYENPGRGASRRSDQMSRLQSLTPNTVQRSKSLMRTSEVCAKISTFRKGESPEPSQKRRSFSLGRSPCSSDTSFFSTKSIPVMPPKSGGPSPLLRKALLPKMHSRPTSTISSNVVKGPLKATVPTTSQNHSQRIGTNMPKSTIGERPQRKILQPRSQVNNRDNIQ